MREQTIVLNSHFRRPKVTDDLRKAVEEDMSCMSRLLPTTGREVCAKRSKLLPDGGRLHEVDFSNFQQKLTLAFDCGSSAGELRRDEKARELWHAVYPELSEGSPGLFGSATSRAE